MDLSSYGLTIMYAIFRAQGKQFRAVPDALIRIPTLEAEPGDKVTYDEVLLAAIWPRWGPTV